MRLGVLDVGSNTVHLLVVDAHRGAPPVPAASFKDELRLAELLDGSGALTTTGADRLVNAVIEARRHAEEAGTEDLVAFATSAVRDASNSAAVLGRVRNETGVDLQVLSGSAEARLTFLAVRRWCGWSAGRLLCLDIGGGSLEIATGVEEEPDNATSVPLGAGRLTRDWLPVGIGSAPRFEAMKEHVAAMLDRELASIAASEDHDRAVATSKTFRSLARICGAKASSYGPFVRRELRRADLTELIPRLRTMTPEARAELPGTSPGRSEQLLAGAVVAEAAMQRLGLGKVELCPWALREGVILRRLDWLTG